VSDLTALIGQIIDNCQFTSNVYNAAAGQESTIKEIRDIFISCFSGTKQITFSGNVRAGDPLNWRADIGNAKKIGFAPTIDLSAGIASYITWFKSISE
jgi:nucleoside-diphosphate-sugar epimerase